MRDNVNPCSVQERLHRGVSAGSWSVLGDLYAEDAVIEFPQRPPMLSRLAGRSAIGNHFASMADSGLKIQICDLVVHETSDPEAIVAEYDYHITRSGSDRTFRTSNIQIIRVRDGVIVHSRDYHDFLALAVAQGQVARLVDSYSDLPEPTETMPEVGSATAPSNTARGVFERLVYGMSAGARAELANLYAEQCHVTHPFLPGDVPLRSRTQLREHFGAAKADLRAHNVVVHETRDPELIIAEFDYTGRTSAGRWLRMSNVFALRARAGLIVESRDYNDHVASAAARDGIRELAEAVR